MDVYLANENAGRNYDISALKPTIKTYNHEDNLVLLAKKKYHLIDVFHTFIEPPMDRFETKIWDLEGVVAFMKDEDVRLGFHDFLKHYSALGKTIAIHSDSITQEEFKNADEKLWKFGRIVTEYFGKRYAGYNHKKGVMKDFGLMIKELGATKDEVLIIGDGLSDIIPAMYFDVDLLMIPTYNRDKNFDYKNLIRW